MSNAGTVSRSWCKSHFCGAWSMNWRVNAIIGYEGEIHQLMSADAHTRCLLDSLPVLETRTMQVPRYTISGVAVIAFNVTGSSNTVQTRSYRIYGALHCRIRPVPLLNFADKKVDDSMTTQIHSHQPQSSSLKLATSFLLHNNIPMKILSYVQFLFTIIHYFDPAFAETGPILRSPSSPK